MNYAFRKKPVTIEAFQFTRETRRSNFDWPDWMHAAWNKDHGVIGALYPVDFPNSNGDDALYINTLEGKHQVSFDDWIIRGVEGEIYPCKPSIFEATYDVTSEPTTGHYYMFTGMLFLSKDDKSAGTSYLNVAVSLDTPQVSASVLLHAQEELVNQFIEQSSDTTVTVTGVHLTAVSYLGEMTLEGFNGIQATPQLADAANEVIHAPV